MDGIVVYRNQISSQQSKSSFVSGLSKGIYLLKMTSELNGKVVVEKSSSTDHCYMIRNKLLLVLETCSLLMFFHADWSERDFICHCFTILRVILVRCYEGEITNNRCRWRRRCRVR
ncbi:MAG: hypothetical protein IPG85_02945 [Bacteroidetes bacterium]|nr:hypothetical protein [Bacteroidota bacterium]